MGTALAGNVARAHASGVIFVTATFAGSGALYLGRGSWIFLSELKNGVDGSLSTRKCAIRWMIRWTVKDGCRAYFHGGLPIAERDLQTRRAKKLKGSPIAPSGAIAEVRKTPSKAARRQLLSVCPKRETGVKGFSSKWLTRRAKGNEQFWRCDVS